MDEAEQTAFRQDALREDVRRLLLRHVQEGYSGLLGQNYCYIEPSPERYPFQWFWDSCFHVIMLARVGEHDLAKRCLRSLFAMQQEDGFVGHMIFWNRVLPTRPTDIVQARPSWSDLRPHMSALVQPPFAAQALQRLFLATGDRVFLGELYARVKRYHDWLARARDFDGDGLLSIITPFESGMDWKPSYDSLFGNDSGETPRRLYTSAYFWRVVSVDWHNFVRRYDLPSIRAAGRFIVKDAGFNAAYGLDLRAMEALAPHAGDDPAPFRERRRRLVQSMLERMYDEQAAAFWDVREPGGERLRVLTPTVFFPLALDGVPPDVAARVLEKHFMDPREFATRIPVPSVAANDPSFRPDESWYIWRGPTWALPNWFLYGALKRRRLDRLAERLRRGLARAVEKSGFREYYNPFTGEGYGAKDFTWSGLLLDMD
ncbi:MAG: amylo-alpha-1,6-glucosidase [Clostridia bacterium]